MSCQAILQATSQSTQENKRAVASFAAIVFAALIAVIAAATIAMAAPSQAYAGTVKTSLTAATTQTAYETHYVNLAKTQAIVVTASNSSYDNARVWFVTNRKATLIYMPKAALYPHSSFFCAVKGGKMFKIEEGGYGSGSGSRAWFIRNGKVTRLKDMGMGLSRYGNKTNEFTAIKQAFDANRYNNVGSGHTYNRYYFKWDGSKFVEYGGKLITQNQLRKAENGGSVLKAIKTLMTKRNKGTATIGKIYYRGNGIINVNVSAPASMGRNYANVTLKLGSKKLTFVYQDSGRKGSVSTAMAGGTYAGRTAFATTVYPSRFPL